MLTVVMLIVAGVPVFAPAPVLRSPSGSLVEMGADTITLKYDGTEKVFKVARDAKVAMNGRKGYSLDDLADTNNSQRQIVTLTIKDGIAHSLDVTLTLPKGKKLWGPGMGPGQIQLRRMNAMSP